MALSDGLGLQAGGFLSTIGGGSGGNLFARFADQASVDGEVFYIVDSKESAGRRLKRLLFPGSDLESQVFQDFGETNSPIQVTGYLAGDDYVARGERLLAILQSEGAHILVHPWWGRLAVRIAHPATISFKNDQMGIASIEMFFYRDFSLAVSKGFFDRISNSLNNLLKVAGELEDAVSNAVQDALAFAAIPLAIANSVRSIGQRIKADWDIVSKSVPMSLKSSIESTSGKSSQDIPSSTKEDIKNYADNVTESLSATPLAIGNCLPDNSVSIVAPASGYTESQSSDVTASQIGDLLIDAGSKISRSAMDQAQISQSPGTVLLLGAVTRGFISSQMVSAWVGLEFTSNADCSAAFRKYDAALDGLQRDIELAASAGVKCKVLGILLAVANLKNALAIDASQRIGRLPAITQLSIPKKMSLFLIANAVAGDKQGNVLDCFEDIYSRNQIAHPALSGGGILEVLES